MQEIQIKTNDLDFRSREAFNTLRTNIEFSGEDIQVVCLTSCTPNEGKSSTTFEMARSYASNGKKTLYIDADLRKSVVRNRLQKGKVRQGLSNLLIGKSSVTETLCLTDVPNLFMIFAGPVPPNPSELLDSKRFASLIEECRKVFDMVIIDTPPLGSVIDAAIVSKHCDGAIMLIESGAISYRFAKKIKEQLSMTGCKILGCILNKVDMSGKGYYGKYYGKYYGDYYSSYEEE